MGKRGGGFNQRWREWRKKRARFKEEGGRRERNDDFKLKRRVREVIKQRKRD